MILSVFMSNLLDNSLEAAELCPEGERSIELKMFMDTDRSYAVIRLENSCLNKAVSGQGLFLTAKADRTRHGIGLKHVKKLIESNHGLIDFDVHTNTFCVTVCLSVPPRSGGLRMCIGKRERKGKMMWKRSLR